MTATFPNGLVYTPGVKQRVIVTITDPDQKRWGFQATARPALAPRSAEAGDFASIDANTQVVCNDGSTKTPGQDCPMDAVFQFIEHTLEGTRSGAKSPVTFSFDWTPQASLTGDVTFYVAANAANGDGLSTGDHLYYKNYNLVQVNADHTPQVGVQNGVVNAASYESGAGPNTWLSIAGSNLSAITRSWIASDFVGGKLPTSLDGVSVTIGGTPAYIAYISPTQINVLTSPLQPGTVGDVVVKTSIGQSPPVSTNIQPAFPSFFLWQDKYVTAQHAADQSLAGPPGLFTGVTTTPAKPGETIVIYGTGWGATSPPVPAGVVSNDALTLAVTPTVMIGDLPATVLYAGMSPGSPGLYQLNVVVPTGVADGDLPITISIGDVSSQDGQLLTVKK